MIEPPPYTLKELRALIPRLERAMENTLDEFPNARPLPPLNLDECQELMDGLLDQAAERPLTLDECFLHGQIMCAYRMAVQAEMLGYKGRCIVVREEDLPRIIEGLPK